MVGRPVSGQAPPRVYFHTLTIPEGPSIGEDCKAGVCRGLGRSSLGELAGLSLIAESIACLGEVAGKFCLTAGDFPRRPFDDSFNPYPDSVITVVFRGLCRRQGL